MNTASKPNVNQQLQQTAYLLEQHQFQQAKPILDQLLREYPEQQELHYQLAIYNFKIGKSSVALEYLLKLNALNPHSPSILNLTGVVYTELKDYAQALSCYQAALKFSPQNLDILSNCALTKVRLGDQHGLNELTKFIHPQSELKLILKLIEAYRLTADHSGAKQLCLETLKLHPANQQLWLLLADIEERGYKHIDQAVEIYLQQIKAYPHQLALQEALCHLLLRNQRSHQLYQLAQELIRLDPTLPTGYFWLANALYLLLSQIKSTITGISTDSMHTDEASLQAELKSTLQRLAQFPSTIPHAVIHIKSLSLLGEVTEALSMCESLISQGDNPEVFTEAGKLLVEQGNLEQATTYFERAIKLYPEHSDAWFNLMMSGKTQHPESNIQYLISILNSPKKRSAQEELHLRFALAKSLDQQHDYEAAWEQYIKANHLKPCSPSSFAPFTKFVRELMETRVAPSMSLPVTTLQPIFIVGMPRSGTTLLEQIISSHSLLYGAGELNDIGKLHQQFSQLASKVKHPEEITSLLTQMQTQYLAISTQQGTIQKRVIDKMPTNFLNLGFIFMLFPQAHVIHCQRHPLDICVSSIRRNLDWPFCDENYIGKYFHLQQKLMQHWKHLFHDRIHTVDYEAVIYQNEPTIRNLINFLELPWEDTCLDHTENKRQVSTPSRAQVRSKLYDSSIGNWKNYSKYLGNIVQDIGDTEITQQWQAQSNQS